MISRRTRALVCVVFTFLFLISVVSLNGQITTEHNKISAGWYAWQRVCDDFSSSASISGIFAAAGVGTIFGGPAGLAASLIVGL